MKEQPVKKIEMGLCDGCPVVEDLKTENEKLKIDLAIVHEHTNLAESNSKKAIYEEMQMIRRRTAKYSDLRRTAGPLYEEGQEQ